MGATAKKAIGIMATAAAAAIVAMLTNKTKVDSVNRDDTANDPARNRTLIAEASATINPMTLLRRRRRKSFWSDIGAPKASYWLLVDGISTCHQRPLSG
jgi:hypothetical protein